jgi:hypothetical protein
MRETLVVGAQSHQQIFSEDERTNLLPQWQNHAAERMPI